MPYGGFFEPIIEVLDVIGNVLMPVAGGLITWSEMREAWREKRIRNFGMTSDFSPEDRGEYAEDCLDIYYNYYADAVLRGDVVVRDLIYPRQWVQAADNDNFMHLNRVAVDITDTKWDAPPPFTWFLPYPKEGYAANKKDFLGSRSLLVNGKLFALEGWSGDINRGDLAISVKNGGYFDFLNTCEYLVYEMAYARRIRRAKPPFDLRGPCGLPNRARQADILDLSNRFAGIGINTATLLYNVELEDGTKQNYILMHHRSGRVAEGIGALHVIPAGSYQPVGLELRSPFNRNMANTVYREFGEELLGIDELYHLGDEGILDERFHQWDVLFLGMGIEPLNTKIEVLTAMQIDMDHPGSRAMFGGTHTLEGLRSFFRTNYEGDLIPVPLRAANLHQYQRDPRTTPPGKEILSIILDHESYFAAYTHKEADAAASV